MLRTIALTPGLLALGLAAVGPAGASGPADAVHERFDTHEASRLVGLLREAVSFPTVAGNAEAHAGQKQWLARTARSLGLTVRDAGEVTEIELPGPEGAPVIGLVIHGDVQPVQEAAWSVAPFVGTLRDGAVWGRGVADDKGPLVQALLALHALAQAGPPRTRTVRLLVGTNEESTNTDIGSYLESHEAPAYSLVLDALYPVVVGEKAWNALRVSVDPDPPVGPSGPFAIASYEAGLSPSIVPDRARLALRWTAASPPDWSELMAALQARPLREGTRLSLEPADETLDVTVVGKAAHSGMNIAGGRNALMALAEVTEGLLPEGGPARLLAFARVAGADLRGAGLELPPPDPLWNGYDVTVALLGVVDGRPTLTVNIRRPPPWTGAQLREHLKGVVERFNESHEATRHTRLEVDPDFFFRDEPFAVDPASPLVERLLGAYRRATGEPGARPVVIGGGTYAKRLPRAIAFGTWFPDEAYPGHDVDERNPVEDLQRGSHVLIEALVDLACTPGEDPALLPLR